MFAVNRLRKSLLSFYQKGGDKKSPLTGSGGHKGGGYGGYFPEDTMTFAVFKILFLSL